MTDAPEEPGLEELLRFLRDSRGFDFTGYKRSSLTRRISKRMQTAGIDDYGAYLDLLQVDPDEFTELFNHILINVTSFFRDAPVWEHVAADVVPEIAARTAPEGQIRVWAAGCASGEEAYTIAMLFADHLGDKEFIERVKIYATDVDEEALATARQGTYQEKDTAGVPDRYLERFFDRANGAYSFRRDLRRSLIFGRHDLVQDAPISRTHLLTCRNTLMYLNAETQDRVMDHFRFGLLPGGYLLLGKSEMLFTRVQAFEPVNIKRRVFVKMQGGSQRGAGRQDVGIGDPGPPGGPNAAIESSPVAQILLNRDGEMLVINRRARESFGLSADDVGKRLQDLEISYRPVALRPALDEAYRESRPVELKGVTALVGQDRITFDVRVQPLSDGGHVIGAAIAFADVSQYEQLREELESSNQELETAMEELQSTNEELETTNEELQSTNEELETTNEELQSTNEELETMNEELQSTNEELQTVNEELHERTGQLGEMNTFMDAVLGSVRLAVIVVDPDLRVEVWNRRSEDMWGLREDEVLGQPLVNLDIGLPTREVRELLERSLRSGEDASASVAATNRRGRAITCLVTCSKLDGDGREGAGIILIDEQREEADGSLD